MTLHRCDVCRAEFTERAGKVTKVEVRVNLYALAGQKDPNFVLVAQDLCEKPACRVTGLKHLSEAGLLAALEYAGLAGGDPEKPAPPRAV